MRCKKLQKDLYKFTIPSNIPEAEASISSPTLDFQFLWKECLYLFYVSH